MRLEGMTLQQIADALGYRSPRRLRGLRRLRDLRDQETKRPSEVSDNG
jgi:hypothetical protein